jgi:hypothetical protein
MGRFNPDTNPLVMFLQQIVFFIDHAVVPFIFAIALVAFLWGVFQYFIAGGADEEKRKTGRSFIIWGIIGFFVMVSIWGIVNLLVGTFNFGGQTRPSLPQFNGSSQGGNTNPGGTQINTNANGALHDCPDGQVAVPIGYDDGFTCVPQQ